MTTVTASPRVGARTSTAAQTAADVLDRHGYRIPSRSPSFGMVVAEWLTDPVPAAERVGVTWSATTPITGSDRVHATTVVTRVGPDGIDREVRLLDDTGRVRESGTETWRTEIRTEVIPSLDFCSIEWGEQLRGRLHHDAAFTSSVSTWDGTVGLRCGNREVHLRIYKGQVIDVTRRALLGATFTFEAAPVTWVDLMLSDSDDFMRRALRGEFSSAGNGYEYLRLTKPLHAIIQNARAMAREVHS
ncbi:MULTISPECIES: hypothetical protein [Gordonia]|uniref:Uncharacterized protein n=1 Tax=Gordonia amicalis TaxID=89053 RepID=A0AAE4R1R7_9ACTN|nr:MULTISPECIES: hypothetical protein [Gordonia]ATD72359.1 hypothetical protein CNO18_20910 [Gordonia sp. 1D]MCZ4578575.1 hypothetical protein [Gordonia amicalis]MCZ4651623.1 hypothetical protein [Gordonia amicalis]MDJ0452656.1 hypothetical protein [Gordonia amicalis]MDV6307770.1 hypothetical protein [Gordonia amicalis]